MANSIFKDVPKITYFEQLLNSQKEKTRQFSGIFLTLIALSFFGLFAINPTLSTIAKLKKELADAKFADRELEAKIKNLSILQRKYAAIQSDIPIIMSALPKNPQSSLLIAQVQSLARNHNIQLDTLQNFQVDLQPASSDQKYYSYSFSLSASGSFEDISKFISSITNMQRIVNIEVFSMNTTSEKESLRFNLQGTAYFKK